MPQYKYQKEIDPLRLVGKFPDVFSIPENKIGYRFVRKDNLVKSFDPPMIMNPRRKLSNEKIISGYALSFYDDKLSAKNCYHSLSKTFHNIKTGIGDSIGTVSLAVEDGMITKPDKKAHFDLFEFENRNFAGRIKKIDLL